MLSESTWDQTNRTVSQKLYFKNICNTSLNTIPSAELKQFNTERSAAFNRKFSAFSADKTLSKGTEKFIVHTY